MRQQQIAQVSVSLQELARYISRFLQQKAGEPVAFALVVSTGYVLQHTTNCSKPDATTMLREMVESLKGAQIPAHYNDKLQLSAAGEEYDSWLPIAARPSAPDAAIPDRTRLQELATEWQTRAGRLEAHCGERMQAYGSQLQECADDLLAILAAPTDGAAEIERMDRAAGKAAGDSALQDLARSGRAVNLAASIGLAGRAHAAHSPSSDGCAVHHLAHPCEACAAEIIPLRESLQQIIKEAEQGPFDATLQRIVEIARAARPDPQWCGRAGVCLNVPPKDGVAVVKAPRYEGRCLAADGGYSAWEPLTKAEYEWRQGDEQWEVRPVGVKGHVADAELLRLIGLCETTYYTATRALDVPGIDVEACRVQHEQARANLLAHLTGAAPTHGGGQ